MFPNFPRRESWKFSAALISVFLINVCKGCDDNFVFEGFGSYLGAIGHFSNPNSPPEMVSKVLGQLYSDLNIRYFRTSYEPQFSTSENVYAFPESTSSDVRFNQIHMELSKYPEISVISSIWSPPFYMKNNESHTLRREFETPYLHFITNITSLMKSTFNLTIERVSPVNEPENMFATWDHTNMIPEQLCSMVKRFDSPLVSICPENSYFWVSELYSAVGTGTNVTTCNDACEVFGTHAYALNTDVLSPNRFTAYYDLTAYQRHPQNQKPIWMMEVSSTYNYDHYFNHQMQEALDLSINIANFVGVTCIQRYYFWLSYTFGASGESLIWGNDDGTLYLPKKYFAYKHFTLASHHAAEKELSKPKVSRCDPAEYKDVRCTQFGSSTAVISNNLEASVKFEWKGQPSCDLQTICCTTNNEDWKCSSSEEVFDTIPPKSVCSCDIKNLSSPSSTITSQLSSTSSNHQNTDIIYSVILALTHVTLLVY